ncbi:DMT family transporter [Paracoccus shanxieyensis]|uniref:DMT family transporter n=1 Tax=Paracoccus shanxieyensis TaxID=2675752 RepID=UPI0031345D65
MIRAAAATDNIRGALLMTLSAAALICNDVVVKAVTQHMPLSQAVVIRGGIVMALMLAVTLAQQGRIRLSVPRPDAPWLVLRCVAEVLSTLLYLVALRRIELAELTAIMQALPLAVTLAAALIFHEPLGWLRLTAIGMGFLGVLIVLRPGTGGFDGWAVVALASMALIVVRDIATRFFTAQVGSSTIAFYAALTVTLSGAALGLGEDWHLPSWRDIALLALAAVLLTIAYVSAVATMRVGEISFVAPFRYTSLIWAVILGLAVFGEWPDLWTWIGSALVVGAGLYSILRERRLMGRM